MKIKKLTTIALVTTMVLGNVISVCAADADGATGTGTAFDHLDRNITDVTLPTDTAVANVFNFYVDPERIIQDAGKLTDGTAVTANDSGVYFKNGTTGYSATSDAVEFEGKNSVDVVVSVSASITAGDDCIAVVDSEEALAASETPALLLSMTVGDDEAEPTIIPAAGASADAVIEGIEDNFEVVVASGAYKYQATSSATGWNSVSLSLTGITNEAEVPGEEDGGMSAPVVTLTWSVDAADAEEEETTLPEQAITLTKGASAVYNNFSALGFTASDIVSTQVKVDDGAKTSITRVDSTTALKFNIDSSWAAATSVKIYITTADKVYVYTYK